jgi:hypothetical protein
MSAYVITIVFLLLILLAGYLFLSHSIEKRRTRRQRLITALRARRNSFRDLATGFPAGFLSHDLTALLYRALVDCSEQLSRLEPKDSTHAEQLSLYSNLLATQKDTGQHTKVRLENPQQIKEAHQLLQELSKFVLQQSSLKVINQIQTKVYTDQINRLVLQLSIDGHIFNARQAQQVGKARLAVHYYTLARKALAAENPGHNFDKQITQLDAVIAKLQEKAAAVPENEAAKDTAIAQTKPAATGAPPNKEWKQFDEENEKWKKKQIYD